MTLTITPATGVTYDLLLANDLVTGIQLDGEAVVETVRLFRRASAASRPRGGHLDSMRLTVERQHADYPAAIAHALTVTRDLRDLATRAPLAVAVTEGTTSWNYTAASVSAAGPARIVGIRTIRTYRITGSLT